MTFRSAAPGSGNRQKTVQAFPAGDFLDAAPGASRADRRQVFWLIVSLVPLTLYLIFAPIWAPDVTAARYDQARCLQLAALAVSVAMLWSATVQSSVTAEWWRLGGLVRTALAVFVVAAIASVIGSASRQLGVLEISLVIQLVYLFLLVAASSRAAGVLVDLLLSVSITVGVGLFVLQFWLVYGLHVLEGRPFLWVSPFLEFANVRFFSQYQAYALLILTIPLMLTPMPRAWRWLVYLISANFWALQWMVGGRAVWAGFVVAVAAIMVLARRAAVRWLALQFALLLTGGAIFLLFSAIPAGGDGDASVLPTKVSVIDRGWESINERATLARSALKMIRQHPLLGVGPGQFGLHYDKTDAAHPHNSVLQFLSEYGLIGGLSAVMLGLALMIFCVRLLRRRDGLFDPVNAALIAALTLGLVDSVFSGNLTMPHSQILFCAIAGWLVGRNAAQLKMASSVAAASVQNLTLIAVVILATSASLILAFHYVQTINVLPEWLPERFPHFWQYGRRGSW